MNVILFMVVLLLYDKDYANFFASAISLSLNANLCSLQYY